jgi:putative aldouronate transport system permease protein
LKDKPKAVIAVTMTGSRRSPRGGLARLSRDIWKSRVIYMLVLPGLLWYALFVYAPMGGLTLAFKAYRANKGIMGSPWVGLANFQNVFRDPTFPKVIARTLWINLGRLCFEFPMPVLLALMLNEIRMPRCKKVMQTVMTFPNFLSWVVVSSVLTALLSMQGPLNSVIERLGGKAVPFLGNAKIFLPMLYVSSNWKSMGWSSIIYLAAIAGVDQEQYEAAEIDGASRMQRITRITLPNILPTVSVMLILAMGGIMSGGFDQIFNLSNAATKDVSEVLDIYIYRITFQSPPDFGFSMAISLFRSAVNLALLLIADRGAKMMGGSGLIG